eukprot:365269-Chlamydomonas_euryale.AAC.2
MRTHEPWLVRERPRTPLLTSQAHGFATTHPNLALRLAGSSVLMTRGGRSGRDVPSGAESCVRRAAGRREKQGDKGR